MNQSFCPTDIKASSRRQNLSNTADMAGLQINDRKNTNDSVTVNRRETEDLREFVY